MRKYKTPSFAIGDKVAYSVQFLKSTGMSHTPLAHVRGTVDTIEPFGNGNLIGIVWDSLAANYPRKILDHNLALVGPNPRFANVD